MGQLFSAAPTRFPRSIRFVRDSFRLLHSFAVDRLVPSPKPLLGLTVARSVANPMAPPSPDGSWQSGIATAILFGAGHHD